MMRLSISMISSTITAISHTRRLFYPSPPSLSAPFLHVYAAALAHLEGIINDPNEHLRDDHEADSESKTNGAPVLRPGRDCTEKKR